jgi:transposase, IS5 family
LLDRLVQVARRRGVTRGQRMRVDTTVVETDIHYPTDSALLADGVRVLTRTMQRLAAHARGAVDRVRDRTRSVGRRVFEIAQRSRAAGRGSATTQATRQARVTTLYKEVMAITRAVVRDVDTMLSDVPRFRSRPNTQRRERLEQIAGLVRRVLTQTRARIVRGETHHPEKVLSLFEPHTEVIRKGKAAKPTEFGKVVKIQEAEGQIITDYFVCPTRVPDKTLWVPSLERHQALFGHAPHLAVADAGFASAANERAARELGVTRVVLPRPGSPKARGLAPPRQRWYRRGLQWRTGSEGRISAVKRSQGLRRCRYRGEAGMERWVGLGILASNLLVLGRAGPA